MSKEFKRNCSSCKFSWLNKCGKLKEELAKNGYGDTNKSMMNWEIEFKVKENLVCDEYESRYIEYPLEVSKINKDNNKGFYRDSQIGRFAAISPCNEKYKGKTFLGLYLGELPIDNIISHNSDSKELKISFLNNPAIFVFDLGKIIYGIESWWKIIETEEDLKEITEADISNVWYVKALESLSFEKE